MAAKTSSRSSRPASRPRTPVLRFATPYYTSVPLAHRKAVPGFRRTGAAQHALDLVGPIPTPRGNATMSLDDICGAGFADAITAHGSLTFHCAGDTGRPHGDGGQEAVAQAMSLDYDPKQPESSPAFFFHLGDVIYGRSKESLYRDEFFRPYMKYPGKFIAIPGNHDGEVFQGSDPVSLRAFLSVFCPKTAGINADANSVGIVRQMVAQPGVYWRLDAPFVDIIGLYSNLLEGQGSLLGEKNDQQQVKWLAAQLTAIAAARKQSRKALILATHHPPFSNGGHSGSFAMLQQIDAICKKAGIWPDAFLAGHAHNYQRHDRVLPNGKKIPYIVAGTGGHNDSSVDQAKHQPGQFGDTFENSMKGFGYLNLTVSRSAIKITMMQVDAGTSRRKLFETTTVNL